MHPFSTNVGQDCQQIDQALAAWRQGDVVVGPQIFVHVADLQTPITSQSAQLAAESFQKDLSTVGTEVAGFVVVTQSCDIVRSSEVRPYVEVAPLVVVDDAAFASIAARQRPNYAMIPGVASKLLVADLDRTMTVEKSVVATWTRTQGCFTDEDVRRFAQALARKRARPAFPDNFVALVSPLVQRLKSKARKQTSEGAAIRSIEEIRVRAAPDWQADQVELTFMFLKSDDEGDDARTPEQWANHVKDWLALMTVTTQFTRIDGIAATLDDLTARDLRESDALDLDQVS